MPGRAVVVMPCGERQDGDGNGLEKATRQCWECLKRRLVCDFVLPHCRKCVKNGKECPGYGERKPLQWVATGKVTSRRRRKEAPSTASLNANIQAQATAGQSKTDSTIDELDELVRKLVNEYENVERRYKLDNKFAEIFKMTSRRSIESILKSKQRTQAYRLYIEKKDPDPLERLEKTLSFMRINQVPAYELQSETCEVVQAVDYFNKRIHPQLLTSGLVHNPHIMTFPIAALHLLPPACHHNLVVLALCHFVNSLPPEQRKTIAAQHAQRILHHRGATFREISARLTGKTMTSDSTIVSIFMLMCCELQQADPTGWRQHADGLLRLFELRGGIMDLFRTQVHLHSTIIIFLYMVIFANCCTPAGTQVMVNPSVEEHVADITVMYDDMFPHCLVPPALFMETIRVNYMRHKASTALKEGGDMSSLCIEALELLGRIQAFCPRDWAQPGSNFDAWLTIGQVFKASLAVYCIMAFQSLGLLPKSADLNDELRNHADSLLLHLGAATTVRRLKKFMAWPLVVAGVEAGYRGEAVRMFIERGLLDLGVFVGANSPLRMRDMLRRYWKKGDYGWEECFDTPHAFLF